MKLSLCITTIDRFDNFLSKYLPKYLENKYIDEIIISDENGNDKAKIDLIFKDNEKIRTYQNEKILGPLLNKLKVCSYAKNQLICLMDSDNFADIDYFEALNTYLLNHSILNNTILSPSWAKPRFNYTKYENLCVTKKDINNDNTFLTLMNTGNYILNKYLIDNLNLKDELENINKTSAVDVIYLNTLFFEQLNLNFIIVPNMYYDHVVHDGSVYIQTHNIHQQFNFEVHQRFNNLNK